MWVLMIVASVGFKVPSNQQMLAYGINTPSSYFLMSQMDTGAAKKVKNDCSWIITEPLGGGIGYFLGGLAGFGISWILTSGNHTEEVMESYVWGTILGSGIGIPIGIWMTGKYIEKEKGSFTHALIGSLGIAASFIVISKIWGVIENVPTYYYLLGVTYHPFGASLSIMGGMIGYRLSLREGR